MCFGLVALATPVGRATYCHPRSRAARRRGQTHAETVQSHDNRELCRRPPTPIQNRVPDAGSASLARRGVKLGDRIYQPLPRIALYGLGTTNSEGRSVVGGDAGAARRHPANRRATALRRHLSAAAGT